MKSIFVCLTCGIMVANSSRTLADVHRLDDGTEVHFLEGEEGRKAILDDHVDPFFERMSLLEMEIRVGKSFGTNDLKTARGQFQAGLAESVSDWTDTEVRAIMEALQSAHDMCKQTVPSFMPSEWQFVKTTGEYAPAPHTRGRAIVLTQGVIDNGVTRDLILHEAFHVYSRSHPEKRRALYEAIGFEDLKGVAVPVGIAQRQITNPDGTSIAFGIDVRTSDGETTKVVPLLFSRYDSLQEGMPRFAPYINFCLAEVKDENGQWTIVADGEGEPNCHQPNEVTGFFEKIGHNTQYIIHPDEVLADNVALLIMSRANPGRQRVPTPELLDKIERILKDD